MIKYFCKSSYTIAQLQKKHKELGISRDIQFMSKMRFDTLYYFAKSIASNYDAISDLCQMKMIIISNINNLYMSDLTSTQFACDLKQLTQVLALIIKSISCLESSHSIILNVYLF